MVVSAASLEGAFLGAVHPDARPRFADRAALSDLLAELHQRGRTAFPGIEVAPAVFATDLARRLGATATPEQLASLRADHVYLAVACIAGDARAVSTFETEFLVAVDSSARRLRARPEQAEEVRAELARQMFVAEPGRAAALALYSGRGDLGTYVRVIATRELVRVIAKDRREVGIDEQSFLDRISPASDPEIGYLREHYRGDVDAAIRAALGKLPSETRALLRYSVVDGWTVDRIAELYGVHRATAARRVAAARDELGKAIRVELSARLAISPDEVDSVVRLVQSRVDLSLSRLLAPE